MPFVSIIIPNYNHALFLKQRIDSVLNQTFQDFEIIILDDFSSDKSKEIIENYRNNPKVKRIIYNRKNGGSTFKQWKKGLAVSNSEWVWIAESDDFSDLNFLEKLIAIVRNNTLIGIAYCQSYDVDNNNQIIQSRINYTNNFPNNIWEKDFCIEGKEFLKYLYEKCVIPNVSACLIKRKLLYSVLDDKSGIGDLKRCGDWFTWLRMANLPNIGIAFIAEHLNYFRETDQSTRNHNSHQKLANRIFEEAKIFNSGKFEIDKILLKKKNEKLKYSWLYIFNKQKFSFSFFKICKEIGFSEISMLRSLIKYKAKRH